MMAVLKVRRIQVNGEIVKIMIGIHREGRRNFGDQRTDVHKELCTVLVNLYLI